MCSARRNGEGSKSVNYGHVFAVQSSQTKKKTKKNAELHAKTNYKSNQGEKHQT